MPEQLGFGVHVHQHPAANEATLLSLYWDSVTVLTQDAGYYLGRMLAARPPELRPLLTVYARKYDANVMGHSAEDWARQSRGDYDSVRRMVSDNGGDPERVYFIGGNELNLGLEHQDPSATWATQDAYRKQGEFMLAYANEWRRLGLPAKLTTFPLAPGHGEDNSPYYQDGTGRAGYQAMAEALAHPSFALLCGHWYWDFTDGRIAGLDDELAPYWGQRYLLAYQCVNVWLGIDKPWAWTEGNDDGAPHSAPGYGSYSQRLARVVNIARGHNAAGNARLRDFTPFLWSSGDASFDPAMALGRVAEPDVLRPLFLGAAATPPPVDPPPVDPPPPPTGEIARIEQVYGITHTDGANIYLAALQERTDPPEIEAIGPENTTVLVSTNDDQHQARGSGRAALAFTHPAQYQPSQGERGFFYALAGDARVDGLGWAYDAPPVMQGPHTNVKVTFARRSTPPPEPPPTGDCEHINGFDVCFGFLAAYKADPANIGLPISPMVSSGQFGGEPSVPAGRQRQMQYFQKATLFYDGFNVRKL